MDTPTNRDQLLDRADAALAAARRLQRELSDNIARGDAECRRAKQTEILQSGLNPVLAISLIVRRNHRD